MTLVDQVRQLVGAGTAEYTIGATSYWTDTQLQAVLDQRRFYHHGDELDFQPQPTVGGGGASEYKRAQINAPGLVEPGTVTGSTLMTTGGGTPGGTVTVTTDGVVTFTADQGGTAYGFYGYTYDVYAAAADVLEQWAAVVKLQYDFTTDDQSFKRSQKQQQMLELADEYRRKQLPASVLMASTDVLPGQSAPPDALVTRLRQKKYGW